MRGLCYYYFPPCGNITNFEPPSSICESTCQYLTDNICQQQWADALRQFETNLPILEIFMIDILNCSNPDSAMDQFPHCCSDAGIEEYIGNMSYYSYTMLIIDTHAIVTYY